MTAPRLKGCRIKIREPIAGDLAALRERRRGDGRLQLLDVDLLELDELVGVGGRAVALQADAAAL
jgi:hypothetical protein